MRYDSSPQVSKAIGIFLGTFGAIFLYFSIAIATGIGAFVLLVLGLLGILLAVAAVKAKYSVTVNLQDAEIEKRFHTVLLNRVNRYPIADYRGVGIGVGGRGGSGAPTTVYFVQMLGPKNLQITAATGDRDRTYDEAKKLSEHISLPLAD